MGEEKFINLCIWGQSTYYQNCATLKILTNNKSILPFQYKLNKMLVVEYRTYRTASLIKLHKYHDSYTIQNAGCPCMYTD